MNPVRNMPEVYFVVKYDCQDEEIRVLRNTVSTNINITLRHCRLLASDGIEGDKYWVVNSYGSCSSQVMYGGEE